MKSRIDIPFKHGAKGLEPIEPPKDTGIYERETKGRISVVPTTHYCPSCSATHEYKYGKVIRKWELNHSDLNFKLSYRKDEDGELYAECDNCGFDLRKDVIKTEVKSNHNLNTKREIYLEGAYYKEACYYINYEDFKRTLNSLKEGDNVKFCIKQRIGPSLNILTLDDSVFKNISKLIIKDGEVGIPKQFWRNN